jgi:hypothetical protein
MTTFDASVENPRAFCELLEATNPGVATGVADLAQVGELLKDRDDSVRGELDALEQDLEALKQEAEATEAPAVAACNDLAQSADDAAKTELPRVEKECGEGNDFASKLIDERKGSLEGAFQDLASHGWDPLEVAVAAQGGDFERWTSQAGTVFDGLSQAAKAAATELEHDAHELATTLGAWHSDVDWSPAATESGKVEQETVHTLESDAAKVAQVLTQSYEQMAVAMTHEADGVKAAVNDTAEKLVHALDQAATHATHEVEAAVGELDDARLEVESAGVHVNDTDTKAGALEDLARHVEAADGQLEQLRAAMEAMGQ